MKPTDPAAESFSDRAFRNSSHSRMWIAAAASIFAVYRASRLGWTSDDAYISFRYARNLIDGHGLVFNIGERVEGYTNFLWTLISAVGLGLGFRAEPWAGIGACVFFALTLVSLALLTEVRVRFRSALPLVAALPIAAVAFALNFDACVFATSGLETSLFTMLVVMGYVGLALLVDESPGVRGKGSVGWAALALALACLTRPDGVVFAAIGGAYVAAVAPRRVHAVAKYLGVLAAIGIPYAAWKVAYYGDLLPNTYYAKSAGIAWWDQGLIYLTLYAQRYPVLVAAPLLALMGVALRRRFAPATSPALPEAPVVLAAAFAIGYTTYVTRVGGDFMFGRLLIPATPFYAITLEAVIVALALQPWGRWVSLLATAAAIAVVAFMPNPIHGETIVHGIANEREFYESPERSGRKQMGLDLRELTRGLPVRVVMTGQQAVVGYYSEVPTLIEGSTGLTDKTIAHLPLKTRGRPGHEKNAPLTYVIDQRRAHLIMGESRLLDAELAPQLPVVHLHYKTFSGTVLTWDPPVMAEFRRRGATFTDFEARLDGFIAAMPNAPDSLVALAYAQTKRFYFDGFHDAARESAFVRRLERKRS